MIYLYVPPTRCVQCDAVKRALDVRGLKYEVRQAADYPEEVDRLIGLYGRAAPLVVGENFGFSGFQPALIGKI